jgi:hypothetical protein
VSVGPDEVPAARARESAMMAALPSTDRTTDATVRPRRSGPEQWATPIAAKNTPMPHREVVCDDGIVNRRRACAGNAVDRRAGCRRGRQRNDRERGADTARAPAIWKAGPSATTVVPSKAGDAASVATMPTLGRGARRARFDELRNARHSAGFGWSMIAAFDVPGGSGKPTWRRQPSFHVVNLRRRCMNPRRRVLVAGQPDIPWYRVPSPRHRNGRAGMRVPPVCPPGGSSTAVRIRHVTARRINDDTVL